MTVKEIDMEITEKNQREINKIKRKLGMEEKPIIKGLKHKVLFG